MRDDGQDHAHLSVLKVIDADCWTRVQNRIDRKFKEKGYFFFPVNLSLPHLSLKGLWMRNKRQRMRKKTAKE